MALDDALAGLVDSVLRTVAERTGETIFLVDGEFRTDCEQGRETGGAQDAGPVIVDAVLETGIARGICPGLAFEDERSSMGEISRFQTRSTRRCPTVTKSLRS